MEVSRNSIMETRKRTGLGRCRHFFWLGVVFDTVGAMVLFTGVFTDLLFYDLLLYLGSIIIFFSLLWWVLWYTGNIELIPDEAFKRLYRLPTATEVNAQNQTSSPGFTFTTWGQLRPGRRRKRLLQRTPSLLSMTLTGQAEKQLAKEGQDEVGVRNVKESGDVEGFGRENLGAEPEAAKSPEGVCAPAPDAGPLGPEAGRPATYLVQPEFTPSPRDRALPPTILVSESLPVVPLSFTGELLDTLASEIQTAGPVASEIHPLVSVAAQSHLQVPIASESDFQNLSPASPTEPPAVQAAQAQALATQVSLIHLLPAPFFQNQSVDPQVTLAVQNTLHDTQQAPKSSALVQEIALSQSLHAQEPLVGQELSQEVPDTVSQLPTSLSLATEAQQSMPHESAPSPTAENSHLP